MTNSNSKPNQEYTEEELLYQEAYNRGYEEAMACFTGMAVAGLIDDIYPLADITDTPDCFESVTAHLQPYKKA